ncbi:PAS domain-containing protein [Chloroflexota bacterium]
MFELLSNPYFLLVVGLVLLAGFVWSVWQRRQPPALAMTTVAYARIIEDLDDGVFVLDSKNRIVTVNQAALAMVDALTLETVGQSVDHVFAGMPDMLERYRDAPQANTILSDMQEDGLHYYALNITPLTDEQGELAGRVVRFHDETARIDAEDQVRKLSQAVEYSGSIIFMTDAAGHIEYVNPTFTTVTGYTLNEVLGHTPRLLQSGESSPAVYATLWEKLSAGQEWRGEFHNRKKNGELYWVQSTISPVLDASGTITHFVSIQEDVTEQKRMIEQERRQRILAEALRDNAAMINSTLNLTEVLDRVLDNIERVLDVPHDLIRIMLISEQGTASAVVFRAVPGATVNAVKMRTLQLPVSTTRNLYEVVSSGQPVIIPDVSQYEGWIETRTTPLVQAVLTLPIRLENEIIGFLQLDATEQDIFTAEHADMLQPFADQAAIAIRNARMFGSSQDQVYRLDLLNRITTISLGTLDIAALLAEFVEVTAAITGGEGCVINLWDGENNQVETSVVSSSCRMRWQDVSAATLNTFTGAVLRAGETLALVEDAPTIAAYPGLDVVLRDRMVWALPLQAAEQNLGVLLLAFDARQEPARDDLLCAHQAAELIALAISQTRSFTDLENRNRELDAFSHTVAHDLRAPLSLIVGYMALVESDEQAVVHIASYAKEALHAAENMNDMIEGLLLLSQLRSSTDVVDITVPVDLNQATKAALNRFRITIQQRGVAVDIQADMPAVQAYSPWVEEVVANLVSNAIKYIGRDNEQPQISIEAVRQGADVRCMVIDNGVGISPENQATLFEMFSRFHQSEARGLGLGLSIVQRIVTRLGGSIGVESAPGTGSTFWFTLPATVADDGLADGDYPVQ